MVILQLDSNQFSSLVKGAVKNALSELNLPFRNEEQIDQLLNIEETATFLNFKKSTIYGMVQRREIPVNKRGNRLYFSKSELIAWVKGGRKMTNQELASKANAIYRKPNKR